MQNTGFGGQGTLFVMISKKENSHELIVPANALWDVWFCDTDSLWSNEKETKTNKDRRNIKLCKIAKQRQQECNKKHNVKVAFAARYQKRQLERSPETKRVLFTDNL